MVVISTCHTVLGGCHIPRASAVAPPSIHCCTYRVSTIAPTIVPTTCPPLYPLRVHCCTHCASTVVPTARPPLYPPRVHRCTHRTSTIVPTHCASIVAPAAHPLLRSPRIHHCACHVSVVVLLCLSCARLVPVVRALLHLSCVHALLCLSCMCYCVCHACIVVPVVRACVMHPSCVRASLRPSLHLLSYPSSATYEWVPGHTVHTHQESDLLLLLVCISQMMTNEEVRGIPYLCATMSMCCRLRG